MAFEHLPPLIPEYVFDDVQGRVRMAIRRKREALSDGMYAFYKKHGLAVAPEPVRTSIELIDTNYYQHLCEGIHPRYGGIKAGLSLGLAIGADIVTRDKLHSEYWQDLKESFRNISTLRPSGSRSPEDIIRALGHGMGRLVEAELGEDSLNFFRTATDDNEEEDFLVLCSVGYPIVVAENLLVRNGIAEHLKLNRKDRKSMQSYAKEISNMPADLFTTRDFPGFEFLDGEPDNEIDPIE